MFQPTVYDEAKFRADLLEFIGGTKFLMAVTVGRDGYPMARTLGYLNDGFHIWLYTVNDSLKMHQFRDSAKITLLWREPTPHFFKFLTVKGDLEIFEDKDKVAEIWERYQDKYGRRERKADDSEASAENMQRVVIKVTPIYLRAEGFGVSPPPILKSF